MKEMKTKYGISEEVVRDIVEWDVGNWWRAIEYWEKTRQFDDVTGKKALDLGGRAGGLSLYWALKGADVICSDVNEDGFEKARTLHSKYGVGNKIKYEKIDATKIPYQNTFDIICFKSVLGGVGYGDNYGRQREMMGSIYLALKEKGRLCFCENLAASSLHQAARRRFTSWGEQWRYVQLSEIGDLTREFAATEFQAFGFWGVFGRKKWLSRALGAFDRIADRYARPENRYIVSCVCSKEQVIT